jgi:hypothetical protein
VPEPPEDYEEATPKMRPIDDVINQTQRLGVDINEMSKQELMELDDWQFLKVLAQIHAEMNAIRIQLHELHAYEAKARDLRDEMRALASQKSIVQSILRTARDLS